MSFLGLIGFVRRFIPNYSESTLNLSDLLRKGKSFEWTESCQKEFEYLKTLVIDSVMLSAPVGYGPYIIFCDASDYAIGAVLCQWRNESVNILEFGSKKFSSAETNWSTREREQYAIKWSIQKWQDYIKGSNIFVFTDHASLQWLSTSTTGKIQRWVLFLQQFDITVRAISGKDNGVADWLSRSIKIPEENVDTEIDLIAVPIYTITEAESNGNKVIEEIKLSPYLPTFETWIRSSKSIPKEDEKYLNKTDEGLYYSIKGQQLYVPPDLRELIMSYFHSGRYGGHYGINKTARRIYK